jgi:hypothetical protein
MDHGVHPTSLFNEETKIPRNRLISYGFDHDEHRLAVCRGGLAAQLFRRASVFSLIVAND